MPPPINLTVLQLTTADARRLAACNNPEGGTVAVTIRPDTRRTGWIARDLLAAVGVRHDVTGHSRSDATDYQLAATWLDAHHIRDLLVIGIEMLAPDLLADLIDLTDLTGTTLWLVADHTLPERTTDALDDWPVAALPPARFTDRWLSIEQPPPAPSSADDEGPTSQFPSQVPNDDFTTFRAACCNLLDADAFAVIDRHYRREQARADAEVASGSDLAEIVQAAVTSSRSAVEVTVTVRAIQAAAFAFGTFLKVDLEALLAHDDHVRAATAADPTAWRALRAYRQPHRQSICALTLLGLAPSQQQTVTIADLAEDAATLTVAGHPHPIPALARPALRALRSTRRAVGATNNDELVADLGGRTVGDRAIATIITTVPTELGFRIDVGQVQRNPIAPDTWASRRGIRIIDLEG